MPATISSIITPIEPFNCSALFTGYIFKISKTLKAENEISNSIYDTLNMNNRGIDWPINSSTITSGGSSLAVFLR